MLKSISWTEYFTAISIFLSFYYLSVGYLYYKIEILSLFGIKILQPGTVEPITVTELQQVLKTERHEDYLPKDKPGPDLSPVVQSFTDEVSAFMQESAGKRTINEELLFSLQQIAAKYPVLKNADCKPDIYRHIITEANNYLPGILIPGDIDKIWVS